MMHSFCEPAAPAYFASAARQLSIRFDFLQPIPRDLEQFLHGIDHCQRIEREADSVQLVMPLLYSLPPFRAPTFAGF
jgi:hypothetical protein